MSKVKNLKKTFVIFLMIMLVCVSSVMAIKINKVYADVQATYYVATDGNDSNPGTLSQPFASIQKAHDTVRTINGNMTGDIYVYIRSGEYFVNSAISFGPNDSGTNGYNIIYKNYDGIGSAHIVGGQEITEWTQYSGNIYRTYVGTGWTFHTLYENGRWAWKARYPNYEPDDSYPQALPGYLYNEEGVGVDPNSHTILQYKNGDLNPFGWNLSGSQMRVWSGGQYAWFEDTLPISSIDPNTRQITLGQTSRYVLYNNITSVNESRYFIQGILNLLDEAGEFYLDTSNGYLYYWAMDGNINNQNIIAPKTKDIFSFKGTDDSSRVHNIQLEGLTIEVSDFTDWYRFAYSNQGDSNEYHEYPNYDRAMELPANRHGAVYMEDTDHITITKCNIKNTGFSGIFMHDYNQYNTISNSLIEYIGYDGIYLHGRYPNEGDVLNHITMTNNKIHDTGIHVNHGCGIEIAQSGYNEVSYSEIYNTPAMAVFVRGYVGIPKACIYAHDNVLKYLKIYRACTNVGDMGPIDITGTNNYFIDSNSYPYQYNTLEQITVDNVWAEPSMQDYAPSGVYMDGGADGMHFSNIKVTNVDPDARGPEFFKTINFGQQIYNCNWVNGFNESLMDYANIGLNSNFPAEYGGPSPVNLASGKTATASSTAGANYAASKGNDDNSNTFWAASDSNMPQWWKVDLGSIQTVSKTEIDFYEPTGRYYGYKVEVSTDNNTYTTVSDQTDNVTQAATLTDKFTPVSARYVRITVTNTSQQDGYAAFYEARVFYDLNVFEQNLALGKTATALSTSGTNYAANKGNDGHGSTFWAAADSNMPQWWKVDLGSIQTVSKTEIDFYEPTGRYYGYKVEVSTDDYNYITIADRTNNFTNATTLTNSFAPVNARYIRVTIDNTSQSGGCAALYEVRVFYEEYIYGSNLALSKTSTASSTYGSYVASNGNEGNGGTFWSASDDAMPQWWKVDLGSNQTVNKTEIDFYDPMDRYYRYRVEVSTDGNSYTTVADQTSNTKHTTTLADIFAPVNARYVRFTITGTSQSGGSAALYEARVFGSDNLALCKTATASSVDSIYTANNGNDGNAGSGSNFWSASDDNMPQWWKVDLGSTQTVSETEINFYDPTDRYYGYKVEVSTNDSSYTTIADRSTNTMMAETLTDSFTPVSARYVRITVTNTSLQDGRAAIHEVRVY